MRLGTLRAVDVVLIALFAVHIPVSLLDFQTGERPALRWGRCSGRQLDSCPSLRAVLPPGWFPAFARDAKDSYASSYNDHLVRAAPSHAPCIARDVPPCMRSLPCNRPVRLAQVATSPPWFQALTWLELLFQFPFFFACACNASVHQTALLPPWGRPSPRPKCRAIWGFTFKEEWIRAPCIAYGASSATAMVPIVTELLLAKNSMGTKLALAAFYGPFALLPVLVLARSIRAPMFSTIRTHQKWN